MGSSTVGKASEQEVSTTVSPRVEGSSPVRGKFLLPATKLGQGNIFRSVCQEFCSHLGAVHAGRYRQQAGGMHPTGMHTYSLYFFCSNTILADLTE